MKVEQSVLLCSKNGMMKTTEPSRLLNHPRFISL